MIDAGINTGDYVIIKKTNIAENGKIVVALIDDHEATLKRMRKKDLQLLWKAPILLMRQKFTTMKE